MEASSSVIPLDATQAAEIVDRIVTNVKRVIHAPDETLRLCVLALLAEGHVILEDAPGVGKTQLAKALAKSVDLRFSRAQFTPDLLPSDVTGVSVYNQRTNEFEFRPGPVFTDILLVDEINRASPKTQAALLECMQENQVTVDGETYRLEPPFMVLATQNPIEYEGTYPLPEAQLDRFMMLLHLGYPELADEAKMLSEQALADPLETLAPVADGDEIRVRDRRRQGAARRGEPEPVRRRAAAPHARRRPRRARRQPAQRHRRDARRQDARALRRPRLRDARRHQGRRRAGAVAPRDPVARGAFDRYHRRRRGRRRPPSHAGARLMLTARGRLALLLAAGMYVAAWALGTREAYAPAVGLALAVLGAVVYVRLVRGPFRLIRRGGPGEHVEGGELSVRVEVQRDGGLPPVGARLFDTLPAVGEAQVPLFKTGDVLAGRYTLRGLPRGRYRLDRARLVVDDPFGLARSELELPAQGAIVVYPRIFELDRLFPDGGGPNGMSGRYLLARGAGFDLHSVRDHQRGESLRRVHWPSTARRQKLMVKELEDAPRDEAAVVLDARAGLRGGQGARLLVRDDGARRRVDPAAAGIGGPAVGPRGVRRPARAHAGDVARGRLARGARGARRPCSPTAGARSSPRSRTAAPGSTPPGCS